MKVSFSRQLAACDRVEVCMPLGRTAILEQHSFSSKLASHAMPPTSAPQSLTNKSHQLQKTSLQTQYGSRQASDRSSSPDVKPLLQCSWSPLFGLLVDLCLTTRRPFQSFEIPFAGGKVRWFPL